MTKNLGFIVFVVIVVASSYVTSQHKAGLGLQGVLKPPDLSMAGTTAVELASATCHMNGELPDLNCTPGVSNPSVTQENITQTICVSGYTKTIRPAASYTDALKQQQMQQYGFSDSIRMHEEDHLISLELGGSPSDPKNLWPEPHASPNPKDKVENYLHAAICAGHISLAEAQQRIAHNWVTAEQGVQ